MMKTWRRSEYSDPIPVDLIFEILSSLPAKSVARCRSVSKLWGSIIGRIDFTELFLTKSSGRPQLLFTCVKKNELFFFSTPQTCENWFPVVAAKYHMKLRCDQFYDIRNLSGLVCFHDEQDKKNGLLETVICNPSTRQSFTLPKMKTRRRVALSSFLGYDPIEKHFKVLAMTFPSGDDGISEEHQVLTLGGTGSWRMIQCCIPHCPGPEVICIHGVLYYLAKVNMSSPISKIVGFDVRSERFSFVKGKLGSITTSDYYRVDETTGAFVLCVLEDPQKHEWSKHIYLLPPLWGHVFRGYTVWSARIVGVTRTNEVVLSKFVQDEPFYVFYYNLEKKTIRKVQIQGMGAYKGNNVYTFIDHVEDLSVQG